MNICLSSLFAALSLSVQFAALADPAPAVSNVASAAEVASSAFVTINQLGETARIGEQRDGGMLSHRRALDPFGNIVRGQFKGLPEAVERSVPTPAPGQLAPPPATPGVQGRPAMVSAPAVAVPTLETAVRELSISAVNVGAHEILIGARPVHEGDLLVLESSGQKFVTWVQDIGVRGVLFCDIALQGHYLKPFGSGPKELPVRMESKVSDIRAFLNKDTQ
jgi:hypothetical protein